MKPRRKASTPTPSTHDDFIIAEFNKLRDEQFGRTVVQQTLLLINVTGGGAFLALSVQVLHSAVVPVALVLLGLPVLSIALALAYLEQHASIIKVGAYIASHTEPHFADDPSSSTAGKPGPGYWQQYLEAKNSREPLLTHLLRVAYMPLCFFAPTAVALPLSWYTYKYASVPPVAGPSTGHSSWPCVWR